MNGHGLLSGQVVGPIVNGNTKESILSFFLLVFTFLYKDREILRNLAINEDISLLDIAAMGDGANDQCIITKNYIVPLLFISSISRIHDSSSRTWDSLPW